VSLIHMARLVPVYPETAGISSKWLRTKIFNLLSSLDLNDFYPLPSIFQNLASTLKNIHFPENLDHIESSRHRLAFDELFLLQLTALLRKASWRQTKLAHAFSVIRKKLPLLFHLCLLPSTSSQTQAASEILSDLSLPHAATGSWKATSAAVKPSSQLLPLTLHTSTASRPCSWPQLKSWQLNTTKPSLLCSSLWVSTSVLVTSASSLKISNSKLKIVVGTHALLSKKLTFDHVGLVVIDEQHRFGVAQRALATQIGANTPCSYHDRHPIPRTIALSLYGDLDLSVLRDIPTGRLPVKTWVVPNPKDRRLHLDRQRNLANHTQCFVVCPFIDDSETLTSVKSATTEFNKLKDVFSSLNWASSTANLSPPRKIPLSILPGRGDSNISRHPVVEVGIDIPNAAIMLIEEPTVLAWPNCIS